MMKMNENKKGMATESLRGGGFKKRHDSQSIRIGQENFPNVYIRILIPRYPLS
jgi:hypothetical protein